MQVFLTGATGFIGRHLVPGGVFAMWSDDPPDEQFFQALDHAFGEVRAHIVTFANPIGEHNCASTVYVAHTAAQTSA